MRAGRGFGLVEFNAKAQRRKGREVWRNGEWGRDIYPVIPAKAGIQRVAAKFST